MSSSDIVEIELSTFEEDSGDEKSELDLDEEKELVSEPESVKELSRFDWAESKKYWYMLAHVFIAVFGVSTIILLGLSAPGLWKWFNHDVICDSPSSSSYIPPDHPFTFSDMMTLSPNYPIIHWIAPTTGDAWIEEQILPDTGFRRLMKYSFPEDLIKGSKAPESQVDPEEDIFYPITAFPQDSDVFILSPDGSFVLFGFDKTPIYRHSYFAHWKICDTKTLVCQELTESTEADIRYIQWSSNNTLSYVRDNDLWIVTDVSDNILEHTIRVTSDGLYGAILNGASDWAYEEEVFESAKANYWSPQANYLAFVRFDERTVPLYNFSIYHTNQTYPGLYTYKYPCVGERSSIVSLKVYDIHGNETYDVSLPNDAEQYITSVAWASETILAFQTLNRLQQEQTLWEYSIQSGESAVVTRQTDSRWIDPFYSFLPIHGGHQYIVMQPREGYKHFIVVDSDGNEIDLNEGESYDVERLLAFDEETDTLYYSSHQPTSSDLNIYAKKLTKTKSERLTQGDKVYATATFSPSMQYYALYLYGYDVPSVSMVSVSSYPDALSVLEDNNEFAEEISSRDMPTRRFLDIGAAEGKDKLSVVLYLPPGFEEEGEVFYPMLFYVYGGPDSQTVNYEYELGSWNLHSFLSSSMGIIVASVDNRGTCCKGQDFLKQTYLDLGDLEVEDQISAMKTLSALSYVDETRIGIWGWSYGGYMAARVISAGDPIVRAAVSVAPVTDWKFYDSIYTERYMQTPLLNPIGYEESSVLGRAQFLLPGKDYLLIHGTGDDNVHFQNSADWVTDLVNANVNFQTMYYPDKTHSLLGLQTRTHLWKLITRFWANCFELPLPSFEVDSQEDEEELKSMQKNIYKKFSHPPRF